MYPDKEKDSELGMVLVSAGLKTIEEARDFVFNSGLSCYVSSSAEWCFDDVVSGKIKPENIQIYDTPEQSSSDENRILEFFKTRTTSNE